MIQVVKQGFQSHTGDNQQLELGFNDFFFLHHNCLSVGILCLNISTMFTSHKIKDIDVSKAMNRVFPLIFVGGEEDKRHHT